MKRSCARIEVPPRHKLAFLTFIGLLAPVYFIPDALFRLFPGQRLVVTVMAVALIVVLMMYAIMPALQRLFRRWIEA